MISMPVHTHTRTHTLNICMIFFCISLRHSEFLKQCLDWVMKKRGLSLTKMIIKKIWGHTHKNKKIYVTNMEIWRGCCNQSLESSAFRRGSPIPNWMLN